MTAAYDPFRIRALVPEFEAISAGYAVASAAARTRHRHVADIAYGLHPRERLDLFFPEHMDGPCPVHIFIHGGYWRANDKENFAFPAESITAAGAIAVIVEYALMPQTRMDEIVAEVRRAADWVFAHIAGHGGDPQMLSASGHSAGAHLCSYLTARAPHEHAFPAAPVKALLLISGIYDLRPITESFLQPEITLTPEEVADWSPFEAEPSPATHVTLAVGHKETEPFHLQAQDFALGAKRRGVPVERITLPDHDHMSIVRDLGVPGTRIAELLVETIARSRR